MTDTSTPRGTSVADETPRDPDTDVTSTTNEDLTTPSAGPDTNGAGQAATSSEAGATAPSAEDALFASSVAVPGAPEASPDGAWLAYLLPDAEGQMRLWLSPTDGGDAQALATPFTPVEDVDPDTGRIVRGPQWSPDGRTIAVAGTHPDGDRSTIWLVPPPDVAVSETSPEPQPDATVTSTDASTEPEATDATSAAETPNIESPAPDAELAPGTAEAGTDASAEPVAEMPRAPHLLTDDPAPARSPRWSSDGARIAFVSHRDGRDVIALASAVGDEPASAELVTWSLQNDREPLWSRDGRFLAFTRQRVEGPGHADICTFAPETCEFKNLTGEKASAIRHSLEWVPGRNLIAYVTRDGEWFSISVVNADNKAGWAVTREAGDKTEPRFAPNEARMVYVRSEGFTTVCCERGLHASGAVALDPGEGVVRFPRWVAEKRVAYGFSAPQRPLGMLVQENVATDDRTPVNLPGTVSTVGVSLRQPQPFEFEIAPEEQFSGMLYRTQGVAGPVPGIIYLPDGPLATRRGEFQIEEQALASTAMAVLTPIMHGASGFGQAVEGDLADLADTEIELSDIAEAGRALGENNDIDANKLALVGHGYGGALALTTAGARPGIYGAVIAIDPITDWSIELAHADAPWRNWVVAQYGLPLVNPDRYALRTPATFAAVIDAPLVLVTTANAPDHRRVQLDAFTGYLDEVGVEYERVEAEDTPLPAVLADISRALARRFLGGADHVQTVEGIRSEEM